MPKRVLYVIACGGRPASDLPAFVERMQAAGWEVCVVGTPSAMKFLDASRLANLTGYPVRSDYKRPEEPDVLPSPDAVVVAPATFNTMPPVAPPVGPVASIRPVPRMWRSSAMSKEPP